MDSEAQGTLREFVRRRQAGFEAFQAWERDNPQERSTADVFKALGFLYLLLPPEVRVPPVDLERRGIRRMHRLLAVLGARS